MISQIYTYLQTHQVVYINFTASGILKKKKPQNLKRFLKIKYYFYLIPPDFLQAIFVHSLFCNEVFNFEIIIDSLATLRTNTEGALIPSYPSISTRVSMWTEAG